MPVSFMTCAIDEAFALYAQAINAKLAAFKLKQQIPS